MPDEKTLTRIQRVVQGHPAREKRQWELALDSVFAKLAGLACLAAGIGLLVRHQLIHDDVPEWQLLAVFGVLLLAGLSTLAPGGLRLGMAVAQQFLPARFRRSDAE